MAKKKKEELDLATDDAMERAVQLTVNGILKKYGPGALVSLDAAETNIKTVSTGSLGLDLALGRGGVALGRIYEVFGPPSSGKSTLWTHVIIQAQRRGLKCAYLDVEQALDPQLLKSYGIDTSALELVQVYGGEPNLDILEKLVQTNAYSVIVIDSVSALIPLAEAEGEISDDHMALQARLMSKALRKITPQAAETETALLFVNQLRKTLKMYGSPETTSGGDALGFYATGRISMRGPESKQRRIVDPVTSDTIGHFAEHEVVKNKLGAPYRKATLKLIYGKGYDLVWEVFTLAVSIQLIDKSGAWYYYNGDKIAQGEANAVEYLRTEPMLFNELVTKLIYTLNLEEVYVAHSNPGPIYFTDPLPTVTSEASEE